MMKRKWFLLVIALIAAGWILWQKFDNQLRLALYRVELPMARARWESAGISDYQIVVRGGDFDAPCSIYLTLLSVRQNEEVDYDANNVHGNCSLSDFTIPRVFDYLESEVQKAKPDFTRLRISINWKYGFVDHYAFKKSEYYFTDFKPLKQDTPVKPTPVSYPYPAETRSPSFTSDGGYPTPVSYPYPAETRSSSVINTWVYPTPETTSGGQPTQAAPFVIPTPAADSGVVIGKLIDSSGKPFINLMYLGYTVPADQPGFPPVVLFDQDTSPRSVQDADGRFYFANVPPGTYGLIIWNWLNPQAYEDARTNQFMLIEVTAGDTKNLGEIVIP